MFVVKYNGWCNHVRFRFFSTCGLEENYAVYFNNAMDCSVCSETIFWSSEYNGTFFIFVKLIYVVVKSINNVISFTSKHILIMLQSIFLRIRWKQKMFGRNKNFVDRKYFINLVKLECGKPIDICLCFYCIKFILQNQINMYYEIDLFQLFYFFFGIWQLL